MKWQLFWQYQPLIKPTSTLLNLASYMLMTDNQPYKFEQVGTDNFQFVTKTHSKAE